MFSRLKDIKLKKDEIGETLSMMYDDICSECKYYNECGKNDYDCPAIVKFGCVIALILKFFKEEGEEKTCSN
ncbi:MAG: hypothetical protein QW702_08820 [Candidatus Bathyarchaeia archaeon]